MSSMMNAGQENSTSCGSMIFSMLDLASSMPIRKIKNETIMALMYSARPWPNGWSSSTGFFAIFAPMIVTTFDEASDRLLAASAVMETELVNRPTANFTAVKIRLQQMPAPPLKKE